MATAFRTAGANESKFAEASFVCWCMLAINACFPFLWQFLHEQQVLAQNDQRGVMRFLMKVLLFSTGMTFRLDLDFTLGHETKSVPKNNGVLRLRMYRKQRVLRASGARMTN